MDANLALRVGFYAGLALGLWISFVIWKLWKRGGSS